MVLWALFKKALNYYNFLPVCLEKTHEIRYSQAWSKSPSKVIGNPIKVWCLLVRLISCVFSLSFVVLWNTKIHRINSFLKLLSQMGIWKLPSWKWINLQLLLNGVWVEFLLHLLCFYQQVPSACDVLSALKQWIIMQSNCFNWFRVSRSYSNHWLQPVQTF